MSLLNTEKYYSEHLFSVQLTLEPHENYDEAIQYKNSLVQDIYNKATRLLNPYNENSEIKKITNFYNMSLQDKFIPLPPDLFSTEISDANATSIYNSIKNLISGFSRVYEDKLVDEMTENAGYYQLYPLDYFQSLLDVVLNKKTNSWKIPETDLQDLYEELERDTNIHCNTLYNFAYQTYEEHVADIMVLINYLSKRGAT